jgi:hypothetical protein
MIALLHSDKGFHLRLSNREAWKGLVHFPSTPDLNDRSSWTIGVATLVARHGGPKKFCTASDRHPPQGFGGNLVEPPYNGTTIISTPSSPIRGSSLVSSTPVDASSLLRPPRALSSNPLSPCALGASRQQLRVASSLVFPSACSTQALHSRRDWSAAC